MVQNIDLLSPLIYLPLYLEFFLDAHQGSIFVFLIVPPDLFLLLYLFLKVPDPREAESHSSDSVYHWSLGCFVKKILWEMNLPFSKTLVHYFVNSWQERKERKANNGENGLLKYNTYTKRIWKMNTLMCCWRKYKFLLTFLKGYLVEIKSHKDVLSFLFINSIFEFFHVAIIM